MSTKVNPAIEVVTCDRCGDTGERDRSGAFANGGVHIRRAECWSRGYDGAAGGVTMDFDFCNSCWDEMIKKPAKKKG